MKYYKIIKDNNFIGVACSTDFVRYQKRNHCLVSAEETNGEFIECNGQLYRSTWMSPVPNEFVRSFEQAIIIEIDEEEYNIYYQAIEHNEEIVIDEDEYNAPLPIPIDDPIQEISIDFVRSSKLSEMSNACRNIIETGFALELHGETQYFSLTTQDQLNLMSLSLLAETEQYIPYHADGKETTYYTAEEIKHIAAEANQIKIYHTAYYNSLKSYINSLETIEEIAAVTYGMEIPEEYKTEVLKTLEG